MRPVFITESPSRLAVGRLSLPSRKRRAPAFREPAGNVPGTAYYDVVTKFLHGEIKSSDEAVKLLVMAINSAK